MFRITPMSGDPAARAYLWEAQGCAEHGAHVDEAELAATHGDAVGYYQAAERAGEAPGRLGGTGLAALGLTAGEVPTEEQAMRLLGCLDPRTGERLGSKIGSYKTRDERMRLAMRELGDSATEEQAAAVAKQIDREGQTGRAFYDLTFSAPKSFSVYEAAARTAARELAAAGDHEGAERFRGWADAVRDAHGEAVEYATRYLEENTWVRAGKHGRSGEASTGQHVRAAGTVRMSFEHSTSRATDPHLHTHVGFVNRALAPDGKWRAVHGLAWNPLKGAIAARYENKLAELVEQRTPARTTVRDDGLAREIIGIDPAALDESSTRTRQVRAALDEATAKFRADYGREPTPEEQRRIHRTAGLESRAAKSHESPQALLDAWASRDGIDPVALVAGAHEAGQAADFWGPASEETAERNAVREALAEVQADSATWNTGVLSARIASKLPARMVERAEQLAHEAVAEGNSFGVVDLTRRDLPDVPGEFIDPSRERPVWRDPALNAYALADHLQAETQLAASARAATVTPWTQPEVEALVASWREAGDTITDQQAAAVVNVLTSPRAGDVLVAAAGAGKTYVAGKLSTAWRSKGGSVMGTATSQIASHVLAGEGVDALNATRFLQQYEAESPAAGGSRLEPGTLLVFDEANMTSTDQLRRVQQVAERDGAKVLYFGDPAQLAAVGAGGGLAFLAGENGTVAALSEPFRFVEQWEKDASLRLREGDVSVLDEYTRRGRIHAGQAEDMEAAAIDRYVADVAAGHSSALITGTNTDAARLSALVQQRLAQLGLLGGGEVLSEDKYRNHITIGDRIQWRENVYDVAAENGGALVNREFLTVTGRDEQGRVLLQREDDGTSVAVPAEWLPTRAALGYAGTAHAYEGVTVDTAHTLTPGYVPMTRGRLRNEAWLTTQAPASEHEERTDVSPRELFAEAARENARTKAAMEYWREEIEHERSTATLAGVWEQATAAAMRDATYDTIGGVLGWDAADRVSTEKGRASLIKALTAAEFSGHDREQLLREAVEARPLDRVDDLAAVLAYRVGRAAEQRTPERESATWTDRARGLAEQGDVGRFVVDVARRMDDRVAELGSRVAEEPPAWARAQLGPVPQEPDQRAEWEHRAGAIAAYRERCGISDALPSVGPRPHEDDAADRLAWRDAARAGGRPVDELEYQAHPDSMLEAMRSRWARLVDNAPAYVEPELGRAHDQVRQAEADAVLLRQAAEVQPSQREELERRAEECDRAAAVAAERREVLERAQEARTAWLRAHEREQDAALEAERELKRRGRDLDGAQQEPEQTHLFEIATEADADLQAERGEREEQAAVDEERDQHQVAEHDQDQEPLFEVEPRAVDVARQQTLQGDREASEDQQADQGAREVLLGREMVTAAEDTRQSLAEIETRTRYTEEMLARRAAEQEQEQAEQQAEAEADRARWQAAEQQAEREDAAQRQQSQRVDVPELER